MTTRLPSDLLDRSAQESSRLLSLSYLDQIEGAQARLADPGDAEALHNFRVGLRRLRSCTRAYRAELAGSITKKMRRRLRKLTQATNAGRDTEVQLRWLGVQAGRLEPGDTHGLSWLIGRLEGRKYETLDPATERIRRGFVKAAAKLRPRLATLQVEIGVDHQKKSASFGQVTGRLVQSQVAQLAGDLKQLREEANVDEAHRARISIKRLRYLLEPVTRRTPGAKRLVTRLKQAQDHLGDLHDMHVLQEEIASAITALTETSADRTPGPLDGLRALERLASDQATEAFRSYQALLGGEQSQRFLAQAGDLGRSLGEGAGAAGPRRLTLRVRAPRQGIIVSQEKASSDG